MSNWKAPEKPWRLQAAEEETSRACDDQRAAHEEGRRLYSQYDLAVQNGGQTNPPTQEERKNLDRMIAAAKERRQKARDLVEAESCDWRRQAARELEELSLPVRDELHAIFAEIETRYAALAELSRLSINTNTPVGWTTRAAGEILPHIQVIKGHLKTDEAIR